MLVINFQWSKRARDHPLALRPGDLAASILHNTWPWVPKYVQYVRAHNVKGFVCDRPKLLYWAGSLWSTEFTTLLNLRMNSSHFFDISQSSIAQSELLLWPDQQMGGVGKYLQDKRFCVEGKHKGIYSKTQMFRHLRKTRKDLSQQAEKPLLTKGCSSPVSS